MRGKGAGCIGKASRPVSLRIICGFFVKWFWMAPLGLLLLPIVVILVWLPIYPTRVAHSNVRQRLSLSGFFALKRFVFKLYFQYLLYFFELLFLLPLGLISVNSEEKLENWVRNLAPPDAAKPFVFLGAHLGSIETMGWRLACVLKKNRSCQLYVLASPSRKAWMTSLLLKIRRWLGLEVILTSGSGYVKSMMRCLKQNQALALLVDQKPANQGIVLPFFGVKAVFPNGGISLGLRFQSRVAFTAALRVGLGEFRVVTHIPRTPHQWQLWTDDEKENWIMGRYVRWLERCIRTVPSQWFWDYNKWSRTL
jgi:lauroyl/myristoyl acyltransferase